mgnify:CR=1 FL=1
MKQYKFGTDNLDELYGILAGRSPEGRRDVEETVAGILLNVKQRGDEAVCEYTRKFDGVDVSPQTMEISQDEMTNALMAVDKELLKIIEKAAANIRAFHERQKENSWFSTESNGTILGQKITPLERVGVYAPAGTAPLPSTVLMDIIPAKVAGVEEIILCSPPGKDGKVNSLVLACAKVAGVDRVFTVGGAQAIAAMAYGTQTIPKVDKITGPGNIYVTVAKKQVFGVCGIDMTAGPSEVLVIADETANPEYVAADLLSQAEHDVLASAILVTTSEDVVQGVIKALEAQTAALPRGNIAAKSLDSYGAIVLVPDLDTALSVSNRIAPEHLQICTEDPFSMLSGVKHAGAIFLGEYSPEPVGDYFAGPNHTLPTAGTARFFSPLGVYDFVKRSSVIGYTKKAFQEAAPCVAAFAEAEGLHAHARSITIRQK